MASPKSDDDVSGGQPKLSETDLPARPGVYVQVSATPRKKKSSSSYKALESGNHAVEETRPARAATHHSSPRANPGPLGMGSTAEPRSEPGPRTQSEVREKTPFRSEPVMQQTPVIAQPRARAPRIVEVNESGYEPSVESENTNYRADMVRVSARPASMTPERLSGASVLDAKPAVRSEPPAPARTPWGMIALVSVMSAIITAAGVVALQEWMHEKENAVEAPSTPQADAPTQPAAVPEPVAADPAPVEAAPQPTAEPAPPSVVPVPVPVPVPAAVAPAPVAPAPVAQAPEPVAKTAPTRAAASAKRPVATEPAKPSLAFRKPPESWGRDEPAAPVDTSAIPSNPYAGDVPVAP